MSETVISGQQKYENYREQFKRLKKALDNGFNLEAIFIEYAIMEDRTESIIRHAGKWEAYLRKKRGGNPTIHSKVKYIQKRLNKREQLSISVFQMIYWSVYLSGRMKGTV